VLDDLRFFCDHLGQAARRNDFRILAQFLAETSHQAFHKAHVAEEDARLQGCHGVRADSARRCSDLDAVQLGRARKQSLRCDPDAWRYGTAQVIALAGDGIEGGGRPKVDHTCRTAILGLDSGTIHYTIRTHLTRVLVTYADPCLHPCIHHEGILTHILGADTAERARERRHNAGDGRTRNSRRIDAPVRHELQQRDAILIRHPVVYCSKPPSRGQLLCPVDTQRDVGVSDINCKEHTNLQPDHQRMSPGASKRLVSTTRLSSPMINTTGTQSSGSGSSNIP